MESFEPAFPGTSVHLPLEAEKGGLQPGGQPNLGIAGEKGKAEPICSG